MKLDIETGIATFIADAVAVSTLPASLKTIQIVAASGETTLAESEHQPCIIVAIEDQPQEVGRLSYATVNLMVSTPTIRGLADDHLAVGRMLESIFPPAIAPGVPPNIGLISDAIKMATGDKYVTGGYAVTNTEAVTENGRWVSNHRLKMGLCRDDVSPIAPEESVTFSEW